LERDGRLRAPNISGSSSTPRERTRSPSGRRDSNPPLDPCRRAIAENRCDVVDGLINVLIDEHSGGGRLAEMQQRSVWKTGIGIAISVVVGWLYWAVLFGPDRLNAPFF